MSTILNSLRRALPLVAAFSMATAMVACGGDSDSVTGPTPGNDGGGGSGTSKGTLRMTNSSEHSAFYIYVKSCSSSDWGADRLGSSILSVGESANLNLNPGCYDVRAKTSNSIGKQVTFGDVQIASNQTKQVTITAWPDTQ
ncbi:MAG TPA: hypothetical protein VJ596_11170 [Gemmatimonadaceae bacterium]|nr:hypothetical protein [Gemmatimonadaceae bacterium]